MARGDVAYFNLPLPRGSRVQGGRRPAVLVIADSALIGNPIVTIVPLTSNITATRFPFTFRIDPSSQNGLTVPSIALVYQLCAADRTHLDHVVGKLEDVHLTMIDDLIKQMLGM